MHLVLRSSKAKGEWSFLRKKNYLAIESILVRFSARHGVRILHAANVGNHLHLHIRLDSRRSYRPFIRAVTAAIMMAVTGRSRWSKRVQSKGATSQPVSAQKFWDYRPFTRIVVGFRAVLGLRDYIAINRLEGSGVSRETARVLVRSG